MSGHKELQVHKVLQETEVRLVIQVLKVQQGLRDQGVLQEPQEISGHKVQREL